MIEEVKAFICENFSTATFDETGEWMNVFIEPVNLKALALILRDKQLFNFDYLFCLTCIDWKTHLTMVYHLSSTGHRNSIVLKCNLINEKPEIDSVTDIWRTAEFHEREVFDLFGVQFTNHPDLRRLFLTDDFVGWPLRKDYDDPVNMIKL